MRAAWIDLVRLPAFALSEVAIGQLLWDVFMPGMGTVVIAVCYALVILLQVAATRKTLACLRRPPLTVLPETLPPAVVVLCLRGGDESLKEALQRLTSFDYPDYQLRIVLDSETDSARSVVERYLAAHPASHVDVSYLHHRPRTCSGKIAGLLQATENLPDNCGMVAVFDADAVMSSSCLADLAVPLLQGAGLTTGNRWYTPSGRTAGGMIRYVWNGLAVCVMSSCHIPWGGCLAVPATTMRHPELRKRLGLAFGEDSTMATFVREQGQDVQLVPEAFLVNQEECTVTGLYNFLLRQYLTVRLHNPFWPLVMGGIVALSLSAVLGYGGLPFAGTLTLPLATGLTGITLAVVWQLLACSRAIRRHQPDSGTVYRRFSWKQGLLMLPAMFGCAVMSSVAVLHAAVTRVHEWRGITYRFGGQPPVKIVSVRTADPVVSETTSSTASRRAA